MQVGTYRCSDDACDETWIAEIPSFLLPDPECVCGELACLVEVCQIVPATEARLSA